PELVELGGDQHGRPADLGEEPEELDLLALEPAPHVDEHDHATQRRALAEIRLDERPPRGALARRTHREPIARQVDDPEPLVLQEEVELSRPSRRARRPREAAPAEDGVDERRFPHVRPPANGDLGWSRRRLLPGLGGRPLEPSYSDPRFHLGSGPDASMGSSVARTTAVPRPA